MILALVASALAQEVGGFVEVRGTASAGVDGTPWQLVERFRPELEAPLVVVDGTTRAALGVTVEAAFAQGRDLGDEVQRTVEQSALGPLLEAAGCAWPGHENELLRIDGVSDYL